MGFGGCLRLLQIPTVTRHIDKQVFPCTRARIALKCVPKVQITGSQIVCGLQRLSRAKPTSKAVDCTSSSLAVSVSSCGSTILSRPALIRLLSFCFSGGGEAVSRSGCAFAWFTGLGNFVWSACSGLAPPFSTPAFLSEWVVRPPSWFQIFFACSPWSVSECLKFPYLFTLCHLLIKQVYNSDVVEVINVSSVT